MTTTLETGLPPIAKRPFKGYFLIWGFAALLILLIGFSVYKKNASDEQLEIDSINRANRNLARTLQEHALGTLKGIDQALHFLEFQYARRGLEVDIGQYVREGAFVNPVVDQLGVIDDKGVYVLSSHPGHEAADVSEREHFRVHSLADTRQLFVGKPVFDRANGRWSIPMARRISKADGSFGGAFVASLDPFRFTSTLGDLDIGSRGVVSLVGTDGVIRAWRNGADANVGQKLTGSPVFDPAAADAHGTYSAVSAVDGVDRLHAYRRIPDFPLIVVVGVDRDEALAAVRARANTHVLFAIAVAAIVLAIAIASTLLLARQRRIAGELDAARARAEDANRLKSDFLASMSHELRTPLNGIIGYAEFLKDAADDPEARDFAATIKVSGQHLLELVNSILELAKIEAGKMEIQPRVQDVRDLVQLVYKVYLPAAREKGLGFSVHVADDVPVGIVCDRMRMLQILNNVVHNAIKFTRDGRVDVEVRRDGNSVRFAVKDTGPGIAPEHQRVVFEKFRQVGGFVTRENGGTGLGLALSQQLAGLMGGRIELVSAVGRGSEFCVTLPCMPAAVMAGTVAEAVA